jgi:5-formyltetrahydrofolate cyclo-ligase
MREQKESVRKILRQKKEAMLPEDRLSKSQRICRHLMNVISDGETVMVFTSKEKEVNTRPLIMALFGQGNPVVVPIIVKEDYSLRLSYLRDFSALVPSTFGVPEPIGSEIPAAADDIDTIILPMLGFDRKGGRIGYGAGYYDRFLSKTPGLRKIGIAFACQEVDNLPVDENDIRMDAIITEDGMVYPDGGTGSGDQRHRDT